MSGAMTAQETTNALQPAHLAAPVAETADAVPLTYSVSETARALGVSPTSVYRLVQRRLLRPIVGLRHKRFARRQIHEFVRGEAGHD